MDMVILTMVGVIHIMVGVITTTIIVTGEVEAITPVIHPIQFIQITVTLTEKEGLLTRMLAVVVEAEEIQVQEQWLPQIQEQMVAREAQVLKKQL